MIELRIEELLDEMQELDELLASNPLNSWASARRKYLETLVKELMK